MCNVANRLAAAFLIAVSVSSCGDSDRESALQLSETAENELKSGNYQAAITALDTLDTKYASEVEVRRSSMKFRAMAVEGLTIKRIREVDDTLAVLKNQLDRYGESFEYIANPGKGLGGNYIDRSIVKLKSDILPRINDDGYFTLSIRINGRPIGFSRLTFVDGAMSASTVPVEPSRLVKVENSEMTVLQQEDVADAVTWLASHMTAAEYELVGSKSVIRNKLSETLVKAIVNTWNFASAKQAYRLALIEREKLERKLQLCRDQLANVIDR